MFSERDQINQLRERVDNLERHAVGLKTATWIDMPLKERQRDSISELADWRKKVRSEDSPIQFLGRELRADRQDLTVADMLVLFRMLGVKLERLERQVEKLEKRVARMESRLTQQDVQKSLADNPLFKRPEK